MIAGDGVKEIRCQFIILEIRCQFIILARKDELTPDFFPVVIKDSAKSAFADCWVRLVADRLVGAWPVFFGLLTELNTRRPVYNRAWSSYRYSAWSFYRYSGVSASNSGQVCH